jgi:hypothetical protein
MSPAPKALTCSGRSEINVTRKSKFKAVSAMTWKERSEVLVLKLGALGAPGEHSGDKPLPRPHNPQFSARVV